MNKAYLHEIFSSIQGEGPLVGVRQIFARLCGCNLTCEYCDTPTSRGQLAEARIEQTAGTRDFVQVANPIEAAVFIKAIAKLNNPPHHSLALTGGEPLLQADFLLAVLPKLRELLPIYLETNGTLPNELNKVLPYLDFISMDIKLASATGCAPDFAAHRAFLIIADQRRIELNNMLAAFVKIVVTGETTDAELQAAFSVITEVDRSIEVILQPASPVPGMAIKPPMPTQVLHWQTLGLAQLAQVRVIPQTHKLMGQL